MLTANPHAVPPIVRAWKCVVCGAVVDVGTPLSWRCPASSDDDRHHVLAPQSDVAPLRREKGDDDDNPFLAFRRYLAWDSFAAALGLDVDRRVATVRECDARVAAVAGTGFRITPFARADRLSAALGFSADGGVWVKDETNNVAGSHKARHLFVELLHLVTLEQVGRAPWRSVDERPSLAIASCGNAAIAASTLAKSQQWPISVFVPTSADADVLAMLAHLDANVVVCPRRDDDPPGDPCVHRFREAVHGGAVPFGVQGTENGWCLDGGRTIGWEMAWVAEHAPPPLVSRLFVQVGGGAFAASLARGFHAGGTSAQLHAVQAEGCAPLARAWNAASRFSSLADAARHWDDCMWPWDAPHSFADGILDDETYDWVSVCDAMQRSEGSPVVATEKQIHEAYEMAHRHTDIDVSPTGAAGLAGVLAIRHMIRDDERIAVVFSGVRRSTPRPARGER